MIDYFYKMNESSVSEKEETKKEEFNYNSKEFKLPIEYLDENDRFELSPIVEKDLELYTCMNDQGESVYKCLFSPKSEFSSRIVEKYKEYYTTNIEFLKETQDIVIKEVKTINEEITKHDTNNNVSAVEVQSMWNDVKHDPKFMETYGYMEWSMLESYNNSSFFLQCVSLTNMLSPLTSFFIPIFFLILPFIILKIQGVPISFSMYVIILKGIAKHHFIGKALNTFDNFSFENVIYLVGTLLLYGFQLYQNTVSCLRFYRNMKKINNDLCIWKMYLSNSCEKMKIFMRCCKKYNTYKIFCESIGKQHDVLVALLNELEGVKEFKPSLMKTTEIGYMLKIYYQLHTNVEYEKAILYSMGFQGYIEVLESINKKLNENKINKAEYHDNLEITVDNVDPSGNIMEGNVNNCVIKNQYYPQHEDEEHCVKNDVVLDSCNIITGPNASGKTTYLKTTAINVILSQQIGFGFYESCLMHPYGNIHSYLNIPDTSGRDSLFQSESRRCKEILESIRKSGKGTRHFCIFDELYSGTNPDEATKSAYGFIEFIRKYENVDLFLTTHYVSICDKMENKKGKKEVKKLKMIVETGDDKYVPTYKISEGISRIEGAIEILKEMDYPQEIIDMINEEKTGKNEEN